MLQTLLKQLKHGKRATGNTVVDGSQTSNEAFKAQVANDFQTGSEPDVLFYFAGARCANSLIDGGKVMSLDEIRAEYPDYGANMDDAKIPSATNGKKYVPSGKRYLGIHVRKHESA